MLYRSSPVTALTTGRAISFHFHGFVGVGFTLRRLRGFGLVQRIFGGIFGLAECVLYFAFRLLGGAFNLGFRVARPFSCLAFHASRDVLNFSFDAILIHVVLLYIFGR